jgi:hypothetical protein
MRRIGQVDCSFLEAMDDQSNFWLTRASRFCDYLPAVLERFPRERVLFILFDDVMRNPDGVMREVETFLGLTPQPTYAGLAEATNTAAAARYEGLAQVARQGGQWLRRQGYGGLVQRVREHPVTRTVLFRRPAPGLAPSAVERATLAARYERHIAYVEDLLGRDLADWRAASDGSANRSQDHSETGSLGFAQ